MPSGTSAGASGAAGSLVAEALTEGDGEAPGAGGAVGAHETDVTAAPITTTRASARVAAGEHVLRGPGARPTARRMVTRRV
ncbi:hypothetical protein GCM10022202_03150 [Microbacterium marinilacus]|uniref:Uncharacterized protein n=1 Tax=Microbacterium marinilacus TaxID=415209 RepID=A0ABP7B2G2_9MICO